MRTPRVDPLPRTFPMLDNLLDRIVGRCRLVRVFHNASMGDPCAVPWGLELWLYRAPDSGALPPCDCIGDFHTSRYKTGWNHRIYDLFSTEAGAQEIADALNYEIEEWCAKERRANRIADQAYRGHLAIFPPSAPRPGFRP
jgi:hypothetical protein